MQYQTYMPRTITVGNTMKIEGVDWHCLEECRLIGATMPDNIPVVAGLNGAEINTIQFILASECKSAPKANDIWSANLILTQFEQIEPEDLQGKQIAAVKFTPEVLILFTADKQYVRITASHGYDNDVELSYMDRIEIYELHRMGQISDEAWKKFNDDCEAERLTAIERAKLQRFKTAAAQIGLGMETVEKILRAT